jgi:ABC-type uncharacterized transport system substrate-binding protein
MSNGSNLPQWTEMQKTAQTNGIQTQLFDVQNAADIATAFDEAGKHKAGAIVVGIDTLTQSNQRLFTELAAHRLPAIYSSTEFVDAGGLVSFGGNCPDQNRGAPTFVDKILKAPSQATRRSSNPPNSNWSSTSRAPKPWAWSRRQCCWRAQMR